MRNYILNQSGIKDVVFPVHQSSKDFFDGIYEKGCYSMGSRILIADDDDLVRTAVHKILTMFDHDVIAVRSGQEVLDQVSDDFDVIVLDINMPDMDGFETLEHLNKKNLDIPVLFLTGAGSMDYAVKAINLGAYDFHDQAY